MGHDRAVEVVLDDARADAHAAALEVDLADRVHVARGVEHDALAGGLAGEARAGAARDDRDARAGGEPDRGGDVVGVARERDEQRRVGVQAGVGGVEMAGVVVGPYVAAQLPRQLVLNRHIDLIPTLLGG